MAYLRKNGATSNVIRFKLVNATTGNGLTGLTGSTGGLVISTICDVEASPTAYTAAGSSIQTIAALGTYAAPSANDCRFSEISSSDHPGLYEFQFADARFAVSGAKQLVITVTGATNLLQSDYNIELTATDVQDGVHGGMSAIPNASPAANGGLPTVDASNNVHGLQTRTVSDSSVIGTALIGSNMGTVLSVTGNVGGSVLGSVGSISGVTFPTNFAALGITGAGKISEVVLCDTITTYTGNTPQSGDTYGVVTNGTYGNSALNSSLVNIYSIANSTLTEATSGTTATLNIASGATVVRAYGSTGNPIQNDVFAYSVESGLTFLQASRLVSAALGGVLSGAGGTSVTILGAGVATQRISAEVDENGDRTAVTLSL